MSRNNLFRKVKTLLLFLLSFSALCVGQSVEIQSERLISDGIDFPLSEPHLVIDPNDPDHWMVGAILTKEWVEGSSAETYIVLLQSWDGGITWEEKHFDNQIAMGFDPWLSINNTGTAILTALNRLKSEADGINLFVYTSADSGKTWGETPLNLGRHHDRQSVVVDPITQSFLIVSSQLNYDSQGRAVWGLNAIRLARTGYLLSATFHPLSNIDKNNGTPVITPENKLIVPYVDYLVNGEMLETRRNWLITSDDMGKTFSAPLLLSENGRYPRILLDTLATGNPQLHYLNATGIFRDYSGIESKTSSDYGYSWNEVVDIDQYTGDNPYIRNPEWTINKDGIIGVFWYDRRNNPGTEYHDLYFAYSDDHGKSYSEPTKITSQSSKANPEINGMVDTRFPVGGDYFGLGTLPDGSFIPVWVDYRNGFPQLFSAIVKVNL